MRDRDHLLNTEKQWTSERFAALLRRHQSLIFDVDREIHELKHRECPPVPLLGHFALQGAFNRYHATYDPTKDIDGLCLAIDQATKGDRFHQIERDQAGLTIEAIQIQKPYIYEGIIR